MKISQSTLSTGDFPLPQKYSTTSTSTSWYVVDNDNDCEEDIFKQITSLLGLKIINVSITKEKIVLICKRRTKKFILEIKDNKIFILNSRDELIIGIKLPEAISYDEYTYNDYTKNLPNYWNTITTSHTGLTDSALIITATDMIGKLDK